MDDYELARSNGFTTLVILVEVGDITVTPLRSTFYHGIGDDIDWARTSQLWQASACLGMVPASIRSAPMARDPSAMKRRAPACVLLEEWILEERTTIHESHFFGNWELRKGIEEAQVQ